jgi:hypothetical protein
MEIKMKNTKEQYTTSYWDENGKYQKEYDTLFDKLVPTSGRAKTNDGNIIRALSCLWYDYCNNGNCNVAEMDYKYGVENTRLVGRGKESVDYIRYNVPQIEDELQGVIDLIFASVDDSGDGRLNYDYNQSEMDVYNRLTNKCIEYILNKHGVKNEKI